MGISIIQNPVPKVLVDSKGDMYVATADNAVGKLSVGANNTVLIADSSQTAGVKWDNLPTQQQEIASVFFFS